MCLIAAILDHIEYCRKFYWMALLEPCFLLAPDFPRELVNIAGNWANLRSPEPASLGLATEMQGWQTPQAIVKAKV